MDDKSEPRLEDFPLRARDKLRYADTDRQGHVNNAVFATFLETGRVELFYDPKRPLTAPGASFVIASVRIDYLREILWPGEVEIGTRIARVGRSSVTVEQGIFQGGVLAARGESVIVQVDGETRRSRPLEAWTVEILEGLRV